MFTLSRLPSLARVATLSLALAVPAIGLAGAAHADDEYGTNRSPSILQSAQSAFANKSETPLARATAAAKAASSVYAANRSSVATDATVGGKLDLNGQGGAQDQLGQEIYHPGTGTDW
jgi:hypothetical protein